MCYIVFLSFSLWGCKCCWNIGWNFVVEVSDKRRNLQQVKGLSFGFILFLVLSLFGRGRCCIDGKNAHDGKFLGCLVMNLQEC
jgi:hypothetical protein